jgi:hypothetical protein
MKQRPRIYYSASQRAMIWDRWRKGETIHPIAGLFDRIHSSIHRISAVQCAALVAGVRHAIEPSCTRFRRTRARGHRKESTSERTSSGMNRPPKRSPMDVATLSDLC